MRIPTALLACALLTAAAVAQSAPQLLPLPAGTQMKADLTSGFDSANGQAGDLVSAKLTAGVKSGDLKLPKGTVLNGRVTQVTHSADGAPGSVAVLFTQAVTPKNLTYSLYAAIASVKWPSASTGQAPERGRRRGGYGYPGGGYPGGGYPGGGYPGGGYPGGGYPGGGYPGGNPGGSAQPASSRPPDIRFPDDAAKV